MSSDLAIVIVNWNSAKYLFECLPSFSGGAGTLKADVILVDNASTTDDLDRLAAAFPFVRLVRNETNIGFARANNLGFRMSDAPYLLFLNPDTRVEEGALCRMFEVMQTHQDAGVVGCRLLNSDLTVQTSCVQRYPTIMNQVLGMELLFRWFPEWSLWGWPKCAEDPVPVEVISGACMLVRRDVFERVGMFSEDYFMYAEDVDLCYKAAKAGWRCYYVPDATVVHHGGGSSQQRSVSSWAAIAQCGAKFQFMRKTRGAIYGNIYRFGMGISAGIRCLLLSGVAMIRRGRSGGVQKLIAKWFGIWQWALQPEMTLRRMISARGE